MARTPGRNSRRDVNYAKVGVIGRRTGVKVPDKGVRDEHGFEPMDELFSSPEKVAASTNGDNDYTVTEDTMDVVESTMVEPNDILSTARDPSLRLPPPRATPRKSTNIGGSPRRSVGPSSSPTRHFSDLSPTTRAASQPAQSNAKRLLKFGPSDDKTKSVERTPRTESQSSQLRRPTKTPPSRARARNILDLPTDEDEEEMIQTNGYAYPPPVEPEDLPQTNGVDEERSPDEDQLPQIEDEVQAEVGAEDAKIMSPPKKRPGRPKRASLPAKPAPQSAESGPEPSRGRGRKRKGAAVEHEAAAAKKRKPLEPAPSTRGPNVKLNKRPESKAPGPGSRSGSIRPNSRSLYEYRGVTPMNEAEHTTRSGRAVYRPLDFWVGEKPVIEHGEIKEIIRAAKVASPERIKVKGRKPLKKKKKKAFLGTIMEEDEDDNDIPMEEWEKDAQVLSAQVVKWDSLRDTYLDDEFEEIDVAYAGASIQTRPITGPDEPNYVGPDFRFAKLLSMPFFGAGMVDLTPGGTKRAKNSRKMHMVFFVFCGRVTVELGNDMDCPKQTFGISRGGVWQVPRGNWYAIYNHSSNTSARIFFSQGCHSMKPTTLSPTTLGETSVDTKINGVTE